VCLSVCN